MKQNPFQTNLTSFLTKNGPILFLLLALFLIITPQATAQNAPQIGRIETNAADYPNEAIPQFGKLELTFDVSTVAENVQWPFDNNPPAGIPAETGVSVDALFSMEGSDDVFIQPAFYYQDYQVEARGDLPWVYPTQAIAWKVRFAPNEPGNWSVQIRVTDAGGTTTSNPLVFAVEPSDHPGFVRVSEADPRYFVTDNGAYFLGQGINAQMTLDEAELSKWQENGVQVVRSWIPSSLPIFGAGWSPWRSYNPLHNGQQPNARLRHDGIAPFDSGAPFAHVNGELFMWLAHDESASDNGQQWGFAPCMVFGTQSDRPSVKPNTSYRLTVRYRPHELEGPRLGNAPFGLAVKLGNNLWDRQDENGRCYVPEVGELLAASYDETAVSRDPNDPNWLILTGEYQSGNRDFLQPLNLVIENAASGSILIDGVYLEELLPDGSIGPNVLYKSSMSTHQYFDQRSSFMLDQFLAAAEEHHVRYKLVVLEKSDYSLNIFEPDGSLTAVLPNRQDELLFYGSGRELTKTRWLQQSYWRYLQARWGYSTSVHSWELLNEGDPASRAHHILADEMGRYFAESFVPAGQTAPHPNRHLVTTSFWTGFPRQFWTGDYPHIDYADIHHYAKEGEVQPLGYIYEPVDFYDAAAFSQKLSQTHGAFGENGANMPLVRGETGFIFASDDPFNQNETDGLWLHNLTWAGLNAGGMSELYWTGAPTQRHIEQANSYSHFDVYGAFSRFMADIPLANGQYRPAEATPSDGALRAWGQKDVQNGRFHLWLQNSNNTWKQNLDGSAITPITAEIQVAGFAAGEEYRLEWWNTATGAIETEEMVNADEAGVIRLTVRGLTADVAVKGFGTGSDTPIEALPTAPAVAANESPASDIAEISDSIVDQGEEAITAVSSRLSPFLNNPLLAIGLPVLLVSLVVAVVLAARRRS